MSSTVDVPTARLQGCLNCPIMERCKELAVMIEESSISDLQKIFTILIESIFGINDNAGWGLHHIFKRSNPQEFEILCYFLGPDGPIFTLCYKLLPDSYIKFNFPTSYLPKTIRTMIEENNAPTFYEDKFKDEHTSGTPTWLSLNYFPEQETYPFEYYIFHFAYHLTNPWLMQRHQPEILWKTWDSVYVQLAQNYMEYFMPVDNSPILPMVGPYIKKTPPRKVLQPVEMKNLHHTPRLLRTSVLSPISSSNQTSGIVPQQSCLSHIWRTNSVIQVFLDFWFEYSEENPGALLGTSISGSLPRRSNFNPRSHTRLVRAFIKILHKFSNSVLGDRSTMDELKSSVFPSVQGKIYTFLKKSIHHWPLDDSFRLILEAWLSFIQPWRYVPAVVYLSDRRDDDEDDDRTIIHDPDKWISFVASNLLAYTAIFQQILPRFMRMDLAAPSDAFMLYRVTKVFAQPHLANILCQVENCMDEMFSSNQWAATVRQNIVEIEGSQYQYTPLFCISTTTQVTWFLSLIKQAHLTATRLIESLETRKNSRTFVLSWWEFLNCRDSSSDSEVNLEERKKVPELLTRSQQHLIDIFDIRMEDIPQIAITPDQEYYDSILGTSFCQQSQSEMSLNTSKPGVFMPLQNAGPQQNRYIEYLGDPELQPIRSYEIGFLVRFLQKLADFLNRKYAVELSNFYNRNDFAGRVTRQILSPATNVVQLPKRTANGFSSVVKKQIPPRFSFRRIATYQFMTLLLFGRFIFWAFGYGHLAFFIVILMLWGFYILTKVVSEGWITPRTRD